MAKKVAKINRLQVVRALAEFPVEVVAGHLDLEGFCYLKVVRTGPNECFVKDHTSDSLRNEGMSYKDMESLFWRKPASEKWGEKSSV